MNTANGVKHEHTHEHSHEHGSCGCNHDHSHEHEHTSCSCNHDHSHNHEHDHEHASCSCDSAHDHDHDSCGITSCSCGHDHHHVHSDGCGCGHDHSHTAEKSEYIALGVGIAVIAVASLIPMPQIVKLILMIIGVAVTGFDTFWAGIKSILKLKFDETSLLTIAVIAAFVLGEYFEAAAVTVLFQLGEILEGLAVSRSTKSVEALTKIRPESANLIENGAVKTVKADYVEVGSTILIKPGEKVPLDAVVVEGESSLDTSALTGESVPVYIKTGDRVLSGSLNLNGAITCKTTSTFNNSTANKIIEMVRDSAAKKGVTEKFIAKFARVYTPVIIVLALITAVVPPLVGFGSFSEWVYRALIFLVASCPCAIVISVPLAFFSGIGAASKQGILIKGSKYLEILADAKQVVMDKTGTMTTGKLSVTDVVCAEGFEKEEFVALAASAEKFSNHPMASAVVKYAQSIDVNTSEAKDCEEIAGHGVKVMIDGETVLCGSQKLLRDNGVSVPDDIDSDFNIFVSKDGVFAGALKVSDSMRKETPEAIAQFKAFGVKKTIMLTGDNETHAQKIKDESGIDSFYASLLPQDKVTHLEKIKKEGTTLFVGDGINDAPVLAMADAGVAMGFGTDAAIQAADIVLLNDRLTGLVQAMKISAKTLKLAKFNMIFALAVKALVLILGVFGMAQMWMAVVADVGVSIVCVLNATRALGFGKK